MVIYGILKIKRYDTMARPKKYIISLSETDVNKLQTIIHKKMLSNPLSGGARSSWS